MLLPIIDEWKDLTPAERRSIGWQRFIKSPEDVYVCPRCMPEGAVTPEDFDSYDDWTPDPDCPRCFGFGVVSDIEVIREIEETSEEVVPEHNSDDDEAAENS